MGHEAPTDAFAREFTLIRQSSTYGDAVYDVDAYPDYGWSSTARTDPDVLSYGVTDINIYKEIFKFVGLANMKILLATLVLLVVHMVHDLW